MLLENYPLMVEEKLMCYDRLVAWESFVVQEFMPCHVAADDILNELHFLKCWLHPLEDTGINFHCS